MRHNRHQQDPLRCLRCTSIAIGIWNIVFCLIQFGLLGWQVKVVKDWQWFWENRELPATGAIDAYQARFPGLYAIYTETPERRRVNAMYAIVLIALGLTILHLPISVGMLYGCLKSLPNWILPWFFTSFPLILLCTAYSVLWWSGDIFNEQLTFSIFEFTMSLAVNGICFVVVFLYNQRLRGNLVELGNGNNGHQQMEGRMPKENIRQGHQFGRHPLPAPHPPLPSILLPPSFAHSKQNLPPWIESLPEKPPPAIEQKLRRKERKEREMAEKLAKGSVKRKGIGRRPAPNQSSFANPSIRPQQQQQVRWQ